MGLNQNAVDLLEIHDAGLVADGFDERAQAKITGPAQESFTGTDDQCQRVGTEGVVSQSGAIELVEDKSFDGFGSQA